LSFRSWAAEFEWRGEGFAAEKIQRLLNGTILVVQHRAEGREREREAKRREERREEEGRWARREQNRGERGKKERWRIEKNEARASEAGRKERTKSGRMRTSICVYVS
jgi:hypothetical protein